MVPCSYRMRYLSALLMVACFCAVTNSQTRRVEIPDEIVRQWMDDDYVKRNYSLAQLKQELHARAVNLNNDPKPELIVQGVCSPTGNCSTSIYRAKLNGYQELVNHDAQLVSVEATMTNGYHDVVFNIHGSAYESRLLLYKFDGNKYRLAQCFTSNYLNANGRKQQRATVTRRKCEPDE